MLTPEEGDHVIALKHSKTALEFYLANYERVSNYLESLDEKKCKMVPTTLSAGPFTVPNPVYFLCVNIELIQIIVANHVKESIEKR